MSAGPSSDGCFSFSEEHDTVSEESPVTHAVPCDSFTLRLRPVSAKQKHDRYYGSYLPRPAGVLCGFCSTIALIATHTLWPAHENRASLPDGTARRRYACPSVDETEFRSFDRRFREAKYTNLTAWPPARRKPPVKRRETWFFRECLRPGGCSPRGSRQAPQSVPKEARIQHFTGGSGEPGERPRRSRQEDDFSGSPKKPTFAPNT